jgi:hypothetical protein
MELYLLCFGTTTDKAAAASRLLTVGMDYFFPKNWATCAFLNCSAASIVENE